MSLCQGGRALRLRCAEARKGSWTLASPAMSTGHLTMLMGVPCPVVWAALFGDAPSSLSHLRGKARSYSGRFKADLDRRLALLAAGGVPHRREQRGRRTVLLLGTGYQPCPADSAAPCGEYWPYDADRAWFAGGQSRRFLVSLDSCPVRA